MTTSFGKVGTDEVPSAERIDPMIVSAAATQAQIAARRRWAASQASVIAASCGGGGGFFCGSRGLVGWGVYAQRASIEQSLSRRDNVAVGSQR